MQDGSALHGHDLECRVIAIAAPTREISLNRMLKKEFTLSSFFSFATAGCLVIASTVGSGIAVDLPDASLLVPLHVVEPARWLVGKPGTVPWGEESARVSYSDLDLSKAAGVSELHERLRRASERVCRRSMRGRRSTSAEKQLCISGVVDKAVAEVNVSGLDEKHSD